MGKHKKSSKKHKTDHKRYKKEKEDTASLSEEEWVEAELVHKKKHKKKDKKKRYSSTSDDSSTEEIIKKRKSRHRSSSSDSSEYYSKKSKKKSSRRRHDSSSSESSEEETKKIRLKDHKSRNEKKEVCKETERDEWMNLATTFSSFSNTDKRKQREQEKKLQKESEQYNPSKCPRELNPYWKDGGDGLPKFQRPKFDDSEEDFKYKSRNTYKSESNWRKSKPGASTKVQTASKPGASTKVETASKHEANNSKETTVSTKYLEAETKGAPITEKELNLLAGKLVKAEIMGNEKLVKELKEKLEEAKKAVEESKLQEEAVLLTQTDRQGHAKPLALQSEYADTSSNRKQRKKAVDTHQDKQRMRYFPDDDKYSLKQMFENEKFNTGHDQDSEFMKIASKIRKNDDLDDLFTDNVRRKKSDSKMDEAKRSKAISDHKKMSESLDNCSRCIQSEAMQKHLIVSMGEYVYLCLPNHEPLTDGHCLIAPIRHVTCATQLDENEWSEMLDFRKALVRLYQTKDQDPVFFEIATGFHRYPHMTWECVPLPKEEGDMAPIYFKKAIDESETEWAQNKKLVSLKGRDVRRAIPKGLPYFCVSFGMEEGFAHVIEDEKLFPHNFAQEIIGGMLDLHHSKWRKPGRQNFDQQSKRVLEFSRMWKDFDCSIKS